MNDQGALHLEISTPKGPFAGDFPKTAKVADVIATVRSAVGLAPDSSLELWLGQTRLAPEERTLVSFHLPDAAALTLVATGSGV